MKNNILRKADRYTARRRAHQARRTLLVALACLVALGTSWALIRPAAAEEGWTCGQEEHVHTDACYTKVALPLQKVPVCAPVTHAHDEGCYDDDGTPVCGYANFVVHEHGASCYDEAGKLVCALPEIMEHKHEDSCYTQHDHGEDCYTRTKGELTCTLEESEAHTHGAECYDAEGNLTCTLAESEGHQHTDTCYEVVNTLTCTQSEEPVLTCDKEEVILHTHTDECYEKDADGNKYLDCDQQVVEKHVHSDSCFQTVDPNEALTCGQEEGETHTHSERCYGTWELSCDTEEHTHSDACKPTSEPDQEPTYYCGQEEHTHSEACYAEDGTTLACQKEEHTHTEDCRTPTESGPAYTCGLAEHTHSVENGCYAEDGTTLTCQQTEHTHSDLCLLAPEDREKVQAVMDQIDALPTAEDYIAALAARKEAGDLTEYENYVNQTTQQLQAAQAAYDALGETLQAYVTDAARLTALGDQIQVQAVIDLIDALPTEQELEETFTALIEAEDEAGYEKALSDLILKSKEAYAAFSALSEELKTKVTNVDKLMALEAYWSGDAFVPENPEFKVQYYAYLPVAATSGSGNTLTLIDTSGGNLPSNGADGVSATKSLYLKEADNGKYEIAIDTELTKVYETYGYQFSTANELVNINRLKDNGNYELKEIWVLTGTDPGSTNENDWEKYSKDATFINNPDVTANDNTILIQDDTVIRLVYDTTGSSYTNAVNFYDYDITDGTGNTIRQGINSSANYSQNQNDVMLAFGNVNTGTGLGNLTWNGYYINKYNGANSDHQYGYLGCTFGLVKGLDSNGNIIYADNIDAPNLFNEGTATGKTVYANKYSLNFNREGDTYTLSSVGGSSVGGLEYFNHPVCGPTTHNHIWTNNFWPMDGETGADGKTGAYGNTGTYNGVDGPKNYPVSDDGVAHNNMFGMQYAVNFTLTADYVGPLEYYFFGDDDMWVFLDGRLICDIGGVHSSVGEYVNLWDYIEKGSEGKHTLSFFYTERGLSGSTCYMRFTLPSVSSATPGQQLGSLKVEKEVTGQTSSQEFTFTLGLSTANQYSYSKMNKDGSVAGTGTIANGGTFTLSDGQYIVVNNLPYGTNFTVTETAVEGCIVTNTVDGTASSDGRTAKGTINANTQNVTVHYTNRLSPKLPDTGGEGVAFFTVSGLLLAGAGALLLLKRRYGRLL